MTLIAQITQIETLYAAWRKVRANRGGPGVDAVSWEAYEENLTTHLEALSHQLATDTYLPLPLRRASLPKRGGGERPLAIPTIADRIAQRAFVDVLEPVLEPIFLPCSFGYRTGRGVPDAVERVLAYRSAGLDWIFDADITDFFPSVDHALLLEELRRYITDRAVLRVVGLWLEGGALEQEGEESPTLWTQTVQRIQQIATTLEDEPEETDYPRSAAERQREWVRQFGQEALHLAWEYRRLLLPLLASKSVLLGGGIAVATFGAVAAGQHLLRHQRKRRRGTSQGGPISPLLANLYLHPFDSALTKAGWRLVRYADDFVICCPSQARANRAHTVAEEALKRLRLQLHPTKTRIIPATDPVRFLGQEIDRDGAFPVPEPAVDRDALAQQVQSAVRQGAGAARKAGGTVTRQIRERFEEREKG